MELLMSRRAASIKQIPVSGPASGPYAITTGPDDALWFTLNQASAVGRISLDGDATIHPLLTAHAGPVGITRGVDDALWFVEIGAGQIGQITTDGRIQEYPLPDRACRPHAIIADRVTTGGWR
jgi:virginiamycin B lyase